MMDWAWFYFSQLVLGLCGMAVALWLLRTGLKGIKLWWNERVIARGLRQWCREHPGVTPEPRTGPLVKEPPCKALVEARAVVAERWNAPRESEQ